MDGLGSVGCPCQPLGKLGGLSAFGSEPRSCTQDTAQERPEALNRAAIPAHRCPQRVCAAGPHSHQKLLAHLS